MTKHAELAFLFRTLKAPAAARALPKLAERARAEEWSFERFAEALTPDHGRGVPTPIVTRVGSETFGLTQNRPAPVRNSADDLTNCRTGRISQLEIEADVLTLMRVPEQCAFNRLRPRRITSPYASLSLDRERPDRGVTART